MLPLQDYMLPELSAQALAALCSTSQTFKSLLDSASAQSWGPAMGLVLPPELIQYAADGHCHADHAARSGLHPEGI